MYWETSITLGDHRRHLAVAALTKAAGRALATGAVVCDTGKHVMN